MSGMQVGQVPQSKTPPARERLLSQNVRVLHRPIVHTRASALPNMQQNIAQACLHAPDI